MPKKVCEVAQSCPTLCHPMDCSLPGSSVHGIFQARILEWVAISFSRRSSWPRNWTQVSRIVGRHLTIWAHQGSPKKKKKKGLQITSDDNDVERREHYYTVGGNVNWCSHCGKHYGSFQDSLKTRTIVWSINSISGCRFRKNENINLKSYIHLQCS